MRRAPLKRAAAAAALSLALTAAPSLALAGDTSTAEALFQSGLDAMKREDFKAACEAFAGSNEADPSPGTQINLALCSEKQGKLATAWGWYRTAAGLAEQRGQRERADLARAEAAKLEPKLRKIVIVAPNAPQGLMVSRDGAPVPAAILGREVPVDPGVHVIEVSAPGKKPWSTKVSLAPGPGVDRVEVPALEDAPVSAGEVVPRPGGGEYQAPAGGDDGSSKRNVGFVVGGAGIVALLVAGGLQGLALIVNSEAKDIKADLDATPNDAANQARRTNLQESYDSKKDAAKTNQTAAIITGGVGVVALGVGAYLVLTSGPSKKESASSHKPVIVPLLGGGTAGLGLSGSF